MRFVSTAFAAFGFALILLAAGTANAQRIIQPTSGVYMRADVGGAFSTHTTLSDTNPGASDASLGTSRIGGDSDNSLLIQGGLGLQLNPLLRFDVTVESMPFFKFRSTSTTSNVANMSFNTYAGMVNAYIELNHLLHGLFGATEPYIDAGVGLSYVDADSMSISTASGTQVLAPDQNTNLAWAVGAGVGFPLTRDLKLDVAYRYLNLGQINTGTSQALNGGASSPATQSAADLNAHTIMIGMRYTFYNFNAF